MDRSEIVRTLKDMRIFFRIGEGEEDSWVTTKFREALLAAIDALEVADETVWVYSADEEGKPKWNCAKCGKAVRKDTAEKLYCSRCGRRARKEA